MSEFPIHWIPAAFFTEGHPRELIAIVHHRMVGTLAGTDRTFRKGRREASTHFGVGLCNKHGGRNKPCIHQYVQLGDQAWGNGNNRYPDGHSLEGQLVRSGWNDRYPKRYVNSRTISIEHHDNGGKGSKERGIVPEEVVEASMWLDNLLLSGKAQRLEDAGIRFRDAQRTAICRELRMISPGAHTIVDHHYVAGALKPFCWRKWRKDKGGFPQDRYLVALRDGRATDPEPEPVDPGPDAGPEGIELPHDDPVNPHGPRPFSDGAEEEVMRSFATPTVPTLAKLKNRAWLFDNSALEPSPRNVHIEPGREMPLLGTIGVRAHIVSYVDGQGVQPGRAYWVEAADVESTRPA